MASYKVAKGDTLTKISGKFSVTVKQLTEWNSIDNPDYIVVGQVLSVDGPANNSTSKSQNRAVIKVFGVQSNTDRTMYASWTWEGSASEYKVKWEYATGDGLWFPSSDEETTVKSKLTTWNAPSNATKVRFFVKPVVKNNTSIQWSTEQVYYFSDNPPATLDAPDVEIVKDRLTATMINVDPKVIRADQIRFEIVRVRSNGTASKINVGNATIKANAVTYSCTVTLGFNYRVRCRAYDSDRKEFGNWSNFTSDKGTIPVAPERITTLTSEKDDNDNIVVRLGWTKSTTAEQYDIEYATNLEYFDKSGNTTSLPSVSKDQLQTIATGLTTGQRYYFRVRATNTEGSSAWTEPKGIVLGESPEAPTTWSSTTTAIVGESLNLYWIHNAEDGSKLTKSQLGIKIGNAEETFETIINTYTDDNENRTCVKEIDTTAYTEGTKVEWHVRTAGITEEFGDWSVTRSIDIYANPELEINVVDVNDEAITELHSFPFYVKGIAGPNNEYQHVLGYHVVVIADSGYETTDQAGNTIYIGAGEQVYSTNIDTSDDLLVELSAGNIDLENNITYIVKVTAYMSSGLSAEATKEITVAWADEEYEPNAEVRFDPETYTTVIRPFCPSPYSGYGDSLASNVSLSVYRREYDGKFVKLHTDDIPNNGHESITDPHPALDYARYRVVARSNTSGAVGYFDLPGVPTQVKAVIVQWDEDWNGFDVYSEEPVLPPTWTGSLLKLPYNISVTANHNPDVTIVEYIGREHPVSYYGTHVGETATWSVAIDKEDKETVYALRRLAKWMGDVYVREPSGSGYWAHVVVSFSEKHSDLTIPVSLNITRVEGGI